MITVQEANTIIQSHLGKFTNERISFDQSIGRVLQEDIYADAHFPSFDRVMMDGIAISFESWESGNRSFPVQSMQTAGVARTSLNDRNHCIEIMTGAVLPHNTDVVIPYEQIEIKDGIAIINLVAIQQWKNIHKLGSDRKKGDLLVSKHTIISPAEVATLAAVGKSEVLVIKPPKVAIISTGDELVEVYETPAAHQIRKSNSHALVASLAEMRILSDLIHLPDRREEIIDQLRNIIDQYDLIILSGGVSKGKKDYIPEALEVNGVEKLFHRVKQRPGKPFWFGRKDNITIFALPGNPVSTFMCFYRYIKPWLLASINQKDQNMSYAILDEDFEFDASLTYFLQVNVRNEKGRLLATPITGRGSGDFTNLNAADGFLELSGDNTSYRKGEAFPFIPFRE